MSQRTSNRRSKKGTRRHRSDRYKSLNVPRMVQLALTKEIIVVEGGRRRKITAYEAIIRQLAAKAAQGQGKALRVLTRYLRVSQKYNKDSGIRFVFEASPPEPSEDAAGAQNHEA